MIPVECTAANERYHFSLSCEDDKMAVYTNVKACCLYVKGRSWIKLYNAQKDGQQATANLCENYEGAGEVNNCFVWVMANIDNTQFTTKHTYLFEKLSTVLQDAFTILNNNGESHL